MPKVHQRAAARRDLVDHFVYLAENAGVETAERFLAQAEASVDDLAQQPGMGAPLTPRSAALAGLRKWRVQDFDKHLIFYLPRRDGISVVRVLYSVRDGRSTGGHFMDKPDNVVSLINLATVRSLKQKWGCEIDPLRFRANLYIDGIRPWEEFDWIGSDILLGGAVCPWPCRAPGLADC